MNKQSVLIFLNRGFSLATLPESFQRLREITNDPHSDIGDVVEVVRKDAELATSLLKLANSPLYGPSEHVATIEEAAQKLGLRQIVESSLALGIIKEIQIDPTYFDLLCFWRRSITIAYLTEEVYNLTPRYLQARVEKNLLFTAGLIHDIGLLALMQGFPEEMMNVVDKALLDDLPLLEAERESFDFTHQDVGRILFKKWHLPEVLQAVAGYHHNPLELKWRAYTPLVDIVHIADYIYSSQAREASESASKPVLFEAIWERAGINPNELEAVSERACQAAEAADYLIHC